METAKKSQVLNKWEKDGRYYYTFLCNCGIHETRWTLIPNIRKTGLMCYECKKKRKNEA